ncbi:MAG: hypothetical protein K2M88_04130 [Muribaculaceae bacterium]|nr:hypothetical protein [Muribaculaceae bacterium]
MLFTTNAQNAADKALILDRANKIFPNAEWDLDLEKEDKVLQVHGIPEDAEHAAQVIKTLKETGFDGSWVQPKSEY